ncbi:MAG TPA: trigger factor, partial [Pseudomonadales bacterium]|nr:trigger factor [Pseudomonadales bacterium]
GKDVAGKSAEFTIRVNKVMEKKLPEVDEPFVEKLGVKEGVSGFRDEVRKNMTHEKEQAEQRQLKDQVFKGLLELNELDVPKALIKSEIIRLQRRMFQQFGAGQQFDPSMLPEELFADKAKESASVGLIVSAIIKENNLKADESEVRAKIEELASRYERPEQVVNWYYNNKEKLAEIEALVLEETVVGHILQQAAVEDRVVAYEELFKQQQAEA